MDHRATTKERGGGHSGHGQNGAMGLERTMATGEEMRLTLTRHNNSHKTMNVALLTHSKPMVQDSLYRPGGSKAEGVKTSGRETARAVIPRRRPASKHTSTSPSSTKALHQRAFVLTDPYYWQTMACTPSKHAYLTQQTKQGPEASMHI